MGLRENDGSLAGKLKIPKRQSTGDGLGGQALSRRATGARRHGGWKFGSANKSTVAPAVLIRRGGGGKSRKKKFNVERDHVGQRPQIGGWIRLKVNKNGSKRSNEKKNWSRGQTPRWGGRPPRKRKRFVK